MKLAKKVPQGAVQHKTAGPYSPALIIECNELVVISGQAALNMEGDVVGKTIEEQTKVTLENCFKQLSAAGCTKEDIFKVNVYLTDMDLWARFNKVYIEHMPEPYPVRTAVCAKLLPNLLVEIEMWAAKPR